MKKYTDTVAKKNYTVIKRYSLSNIDEHGIRNLITKHRTFETPEAAMHWAEQIKNCEYNSTDRVRLGLGGDPETVEPMAVYCVLMTDGKIGDILYSQYFVDRFGHPDCVRCILQ